MLSPGPRNISCDDFCFFDLLSPGEGVATAGALGETLRSGAAGRAELDLGSRLTRLMRGRAARILDGDAPPIWEDGCNRDSLTDEI